jgi:hypothetical protein
MRWPYGPRLPVVSQSDDAAVFFKEMGIDHADFFRILPQALGTDDCEVTGTNVVMRDGDKRFEISLGPEGKRTIALLNLPVTMVTIRLINYGEADLASALERFDLYYRRGGG